MKSLEVGLGWAAARVQEKSDVDLGLAKMFDIDARHLRGPLRARFHSTQENVSFPCVGLASLSFVAGVLTSVTLNPHESALDSKQAASLCLGLFGDFSRSFNAFKLAEPDRFQAALEPLARARNPEGSPPPWRFMGRIDRDVVNIVIRPLDSLPGVIAKDASSLYVVALEFGNTNVAETAYEYLHDIREHAFGKTRRRVLLSDYPK